MTTLCNLRTEDGKVDCRYKPAKNDCFWAEAAYRLFCVDAFTDKPFSGNPAAVCIVVAPMDDGTKQCLAAEMNLSETAFPEKIADGRYSLRWFTPETEIDLCGHATLATAHILWEMKETESEEIVFETRSGELKAAKIKDGIRLDFPLIQPIATNTPEGLMEALGLNHCVEIFYGGEDYVVVVDGETTVKELAPDFAALSKIDCRGVVVTAPAHDDETDFVSRCFFPRLGINEDPVTGSSHCTLGPHWASKFGKTTLRARQISKRGGSLVVEVGDDRVGLTGSAITVWEGALRG
jgi:PhzF family phenazine biosynthesis protein